MFNLVKEFRLCLTKENWKEEWIKVLKFNFPDVNISENEEFRRKYLGYRIQGLLYEDEQIKLLKANKKNVLQKEYWDQKYHVDCLVLEKDLVTIYSFKNFDLNKKLNIKKEIVNDLEKSRIYFRKEFSRKCIAIIKSPFQEIVLQY